MVRDMLFVLFALLVVLFTTLILSKKNSIFYIVDYDIYISKYCIVKCRKQNAPFIERKNQGEEEKLFIGKRDQGEEEKLFIGKKQRNTRGGEGIPIGIVIASACPNFRRYRTTINGVQTLGNSIVRASPARMDLQYRVGRSRRVTITT
jgi:hypothetical protein